MDFSFPSFDMLPLKEAQQNKTPFSWLEYLAAGFRGRDAHLNYTVVSSIQCLTDPHLSNKLLCGTEDCAESEGSPPQYLEGAASRRSHFRY